MGNVDTSKEQLIDEPESLQWRVAELEELEAKGKRVEEALRESEERYRALVNLGGEVGEAILMLQDAEQGEAIQTFAGDEWLRITGYSREELLGKSFFDLVCPKDRQTSVERHRRKMQGKTMPGLFEMSITRKDGTEVPIELTSAYTTYHGEKANVAYIRDITERKRMQEALLQTNARLGVLQRVTSAVHSTLDLEKVFKQVADSVTHSLGYTTTLILTLNDEKRCFEVKAISTKKRFLSQISKLFGFPLKNFSVPTDYEFKGGLRSVIEGKVVIAKSLTEVMYPLISKKMCSALEKIAGTRNYIVVPLEVGGKMSGALFITSPREEVSGEELTMIQDFAQAASQAISNANLHAQAQLAEEQSRQSEENLKAYLENAPDAVYLNDLKGTFLYGNKKAEELTGYKREEFIGQSFLKLNLLPAKYLAKAGKLLALNAMGRPTGPDEFQLMRGDGNFIWVEINTTPVKQADRKLIIGFVRDITERKQTERMIKHAAEEWRSTFDSIADLVSIHDKDFRLVRVNKAFADAFKMKPQELIGKTCYEVVHGTNEPVPNCPFGKTGKSKKPVAVEFFERHLGAHLEVSTSPMFDEKGALVGCVHITKDITERKQAEETLIITDRLASVGEMASGVAHELNNPLTSVIGLSQLVMDGDVPDDIKEDIETIYSEAQRAAGVVKNLLTFARKHEPVRQLTQINRIIEDVLKLRAYEHRVNNIQVNTHFDPELPESMVDHFQMQQVFLNIILNAESAMLEAHNKGTLTITTERINNTIKASLSDDGPGIARETLSRIFDPFFTTKEVGQGTGLGLSICYGIVAEHGGKIYARSKLGRGTTFVVELPLVPINSKEVLDGRE